MKKLIFFLAVPVIIFCQSKDPYAILNKVKDNFERVKDYRVEALIKVNMEFLKVPDMKATIYFKQPNKLKLDSKEFAMLPKQAFNFSPTALLDNKYNAIYVGQDKIDGSVVSVIKVIPSSDSAGIILTTLWVDTEKNIVRKIASTVRRGGDTQVELSYNENIKYPLPDKITFSFEVPKLQYLQDPREKKIEPEKKEEQKQNDKGTVTITYSNYKVNQGLPDSIFQEKK
jgi:outer membrane lipoprotein-sorting protein